MSKFLSDEYFDQLRETISRDSKWTDSTKNIKTSIALNVTDNGQHYILAVENGVTNLQKVSPGSPAEFSFDGMYDTWCKVAKGEMDLQSAVLKGQLRFRGSLTKILMYRDRFMRLAELMRDVPKEF